MAKAKSKRDRQERKFYPRSSTNPKIVAIVGGLGALLAGAGGYGQFGPMKGEELLKYVPWLLASGNGAHRRGVSGSARAPSHRFASATPVSASTRDPPAPHPLVRSRVDHLAERAASRRRHR
jgi:hypothetical protein